MIAEKKIHIAELLFGVDDPFISRFFDISSDQMLDEKIEVLTALKEGKTPGQIPNYYDVLELYPKDADGVCVHWD